MSNLYKGVAGIGSPVSARNVKASNKAPSLPSLERTLRNMSNENTARTFQFNSDEAQKGRDFQEYMSNTSHQREVEDLKAAGINPVLSANGGAQAYSTSSASGSADNSAVGVIASIYQTKMNNDNAVKLQKLNNANQLKIAMAEMKNAKSIARINQAASNYASNNAYSASRYASDQGYASSIYNTDVSSATSRANSRRSARTQRYSSDKSYKGSTAGMYDDAFGKYSGVAKGISLGASAFKDIAAGIGSLRRTKTVIKKKR